MSRKSFETANYWVWILLVALGALVLLAFLGGQMSLMVQIATILSFIATPVFAWLNFKLVTSKHIPEEFKPKIWLRMFAWIGLFFLSGFVILYLVVFFN
ncbi:MAG: hypothetical protein IH946_09925 [Bacteroidetes bacterium]|nr:hypothetical protein [Bacteroidota bacterium]